MHFVQVTRLLAQCEGGEWGLPRLESPDEAACTLRARLPATLPGAAADDAPAGLRRNDDYWFPVDPHRDLAATSAPVRRLLVAWALPWLERKAALERFVDGEIEVGVRRPGPALARCLGAPLLGRAGQARVLAQRFAADGGAPAYAACIGARLESIGASG